MQGCRIDTSRAGLLLLSFLLVGCDLDDLPESPEVPPPAPLGEYFDAAKTGNLKVRVTWEGDLPVVEPFTSFPTPVKEPPHPPARQWPNPNAPVIDPKTKGLAEVAVILRKVDTEFSKPWDLPRVKVVAQDFSLKVHQGDRVSKVGFVRRGESFTMSAHDPAHYVVLGRNDDYFSYHLPLADSTRVRTATTSGRMELQEGMGRFWMKGTLYVVPHPYAAQTDANGEAELTQIPEGDYHFLLCHPNWRVKNIECDPNWGLPRFVHFHPPVEWSCFARIRAGKTTRLEETFSEARFEP